MSNRCTKCGWTHPNETIGCPNERHGYQPKEGGTLDINNPPFVFSAVTENTTELNQQIAAMRDSLKTMNRLYNHVVSRLNSTAKLMGALLDAAKLVEPEEGLNVLDGAIFDTEFRCHGRLTMRLVALRDALKAAIVLCGNEGIDGEACPKCHQVDYGQIMTGEYPCPECGLPTVWDDKVEGKEA